MTHDQETLMLLKEIKTDVHSIKRAIYGDERNMVPGLLARQSKDEVRIQKLEESRKKFMWIVTGFVMAFQLIEWVIKFLS